MNIDYTAIITKANERKDALIRFEQAAIALKAEMACFEEDTLPVLVEYQAAYKALDDEARKLLPGTAGHAANVLANDLCGTFNRRMNCRYNDSDVRAENGRQALELLTT